MIAAFDDEALHKRQGERDGDEDIGAVFAEPVPEGTAYTVRQGRGCAALCIPYQPGLYEAAAQNLWIAILEFVLQLFALPHHRFGIPYLISCRHNFHYSPPATIQHPDIAWHDTGTASRSTLYPYTVVYAAAWRTRYYDYQIPSESSVIMSCAALRSVSLNSWLGFLAGHSTRTPEFGLIQLPGTFILKLTLRSSTSNLSTSLITSHFLDIILPSDIFKHHNYTFFPSALLTSGNQSFPKPTLASATYHLPPAQMYLHRRRIPARVMGCPAIEKPIMSFDINTLGLNISWPFLRGGDEERDGEISSNNPAFVSISYNDPTVFLLSLSLLLRPVNNERRLILGIRGNESENGLVRDLVGGLNVDARVAGVQRRLEDEEVGEWWRLSDSALLK
ncbi:hypothetical protein BDZ89DRAFT_1147246 [Hymenopellis radicata]|nr:hypothetical protein BDZ89DRAFT_1147246 [Hymenopellis radicata]